MVISRGFGLTKFASAKIVAIDDPADHSDDRQKAEQAGQSLPQAAN